MAGDTSNTYKVVVNDEEQYSIWFADREPPAGWTRGQGGSQRGVPGSTSKKSGLTCVPRASGSRWTKPGDIMIGTTIHAAYGSVSSNSSASRRKNPRQASLPFSPTAMTRLARLSHAASLTARHARSLPDCRSSNPDPPAGALLLYPPGLEFITAFFGCLYAGVVAVPAYLPRVNRPMTRLRSLVVDADPARC